MGRLFGTDGARGVANTELTPELAMNIGRAAAMVLISDTVEHPTFLIGKDTRLSGDMLEGALIAGLTSVGANVVLLGVVPTPAVAYLAKECDAKAGVMISASHNPYNYNGIKIFNKDGYKLPDLLEEQIETLILDESEEIILAEPTKVGKIFYNENAKKDYIEYVKSTASSSLEGMNIVIDCSNGSASYTAEDIFKGLGANVTMCHFEPTGININKDCGSTHIEKSLKDIVTSNKFDLGIAFDGDADRVLFIDDCGNLIDGDFVMAICALDMRERGLLSKNTVVGTIMANFGFSKFCKDNGLNFIATKVGDRFVLEEMLLEDYNFGGEQSGHIIFKDFATTGDGQLTAVQMLSLLSRKKQKLSVLANIMKRYPQAMLNVKVSKEGKIAFYTEPRIEEAIENAKKVLGSDGRIVVRASGTEPLIRVMAEGSDYDLINKVVNDVSNVIKNTLA